MYRLLARAELRTQWRPLAVLALLVAVSVAAVVATLTAADRSATAFERLRAATVAGDLAIFGAQDATELSATVREVREVDGVVAAAPEAELFVRPAGTELFPSYNLLARAPIGPGQHANVPLVVSGRLPARDRPHEIALSERLAVDLGVQVGDVLDLESMTNAWVETSFSGGDPGPPDGPTMRARVVGIARSPVDFGRVHGVLHLSSAFVARYGDGMRAYYRVEARLADPGSNAALRQAVGDHAEPSVFGDDGSTDDALATIAAGLRLVVLVAGIAGAATVILVIARLTRTALRDRATLVALGTTRSQMVVVALAIIAPAVMVGAVLGGVVGTALAPDLAVGLAARIEPTGSRTAFAAGIALGTAAATVVVALMAAAVVAVRRPRRASPRGGPAAAILPLDRPLPVVLGLRHAVVGEAARGGRTSRVAIGVTVLAVAGVVAALVVSSSILRLRSDPSLFGSGGTDRSVESGESIEVHDALMPRLASDRRVESLNGLHISFAARVGGREVTLLAFDRRRGSLDASIVDGRLPRGRQEAVLGPATLERLGKRVGEKVRMRGPEGTAVYRIAGSVLFPEGDFTFDDGAGLTVAGAARIVGDVHDTAALHSVLFDWREGVDAARADRELAELGFRVNSDAGGVEPARVTNLGQIAQLPKYLAAFLAFLAFLALAHALVVSGNRRVREQATLRALGMTRRAGAAVVATQAGAVAVVALVFGVPMGILVGDRIWSAMAENAHVVVRTVVPGAWIGAVVIGALVGAAAAALVPTVRTLRIRPAELLRSE